MSHPLVARALADLGLRETAPNVVPGISDGDAWCSLWLCAKLRDCGIAVPDIAGARDLMIWLDAHGHDARHDAPRLPGDVCYWDRMRDGVRIGGHVSVYVEARPRKRGRFVAGNSGPRADRVALSVHPLARVTGAARVPG